MFRLSIALAMCAGALFAQFGGLTPNYRGSKLWFSSELPMHGTNQAVQGKIFVWEQGRGIRLMYEKPADFTGDMRLFEAAYHMVGVSVTDDESVIGLNGWGNCYGSGICTNSYEHGRAEVWDWSGKLVQENGGRVCLSHNGRYALFTPQIFGPFGSTVPRTLIDLQTGLKTESLEFVALGGCMGNDGTIALQKLRPFALNEYEPQVLRRADGTQVPLDSGVAYTISADGSRLLSRTGRGALRLIDLASGVTTQLSNDIPEDETLGRLAASADLSVVAVGNTRGVSLIQTSDRSTRQVWSQPMGTRDEFALSPDGKILFIGLLDGGITRIEIASGRQDRIVLPISVPVGVGSGVGTIVNYAAGSTYSYESINAAIPPLADVRVGRHSMIVLTRDEKSVTFQVPWNVPDSKGLLALVLPGQSTDVFQPATTGPAVSISRAAPAALAYLHDDFQSAVTSGNPARRGEVVHVYGTGYGPVQAPIPDATPAPAASLSALTSPLHCDGVQVLFAGLAPGYVGLYQIDLRIPETAKAPTIFVGCGQARFSIPVQ